MSDGLALFDLVDYDETRPDGMLPCGHDRWSIEHCDECLHGTCPKCGESGLTGYELREQHDPLNDVFGPHICIQLMWGIERGSCCIACRGFQFGHQVCPWRSCELYVPGHEYDHAKRDACPTCGVPSRVVWLYV